MVHPFRASVRTDFGAFLQQCEGRVPPNEALKIDLHCHDCNSDVPDELWGRILRLPETWLPTDTLVSRLDAEGVGARTITNHNNARSCWSLLDRGVDVLVGAEFTCTFSDIPVSAHVLTYGFSPEQEVKLNQLRHDIYRFLDYTVENDIPTVLPHPLFLYHPKGPLPLEVFDRFALMFQRFEVFNGQRDVLQNLLTAEWLGSLTQERLEDAGKRTGISPNRWCRDPWTKRMAGGSDDHFGLFVGTTGTRLHVPDLAERLRHTAPSQLALEALRHGDMVPYGIPAEEDKLSVAFLDYFCQVSMNMDDPGLLRMLLHRGTLQDKVACLVIGNAMMEIRRHGYTSKFLRVFHEALGGKSPSLLTNLTVSKEYRPMIEDIDRIARARKGLSQDLPQVIKSSIDGMFLKMNQLMAKRLHQRLGSQLESGALDAVDADELIRRFEVPSYFRTLANPPTEGRRRDMTQISISDILDQLSFPALASIVIAGSRFAATRVLYHDRSALDEFGAAHGLRRLPKRILWLTDTLDDRNGVSSALQGVLAEVRQRDLPIDFLVCSNEITPQDHLKVAPSLGAVTLGGQFANQKVHFPNLLDIQRIFLEGAYDRVICSTEFLMGPIALYLKHAFNVPAFFYMHTDWLDYARSTSDLDEHALDRVRRLLRALYRSFDGIFALNTEHEQWLKSPAMGIHRRRVHLTAHWVEEWFKPAVQPHSISMEAPVLLFAGRLSEEKGVLDLAEILAAVRQALPGAQLQIAGTGPAEGRMRRELPDAKFLGWVPHKELAELYHKVDFLLLPSRFDTFGCVVLEAMSCGLPVAAYDTKGPKDIIRQDIDGVLAQTAREMGIAVGKILANPEAWKAMGVAALERSSHFERGVILDKLLADAGVQEL